MTSNTGSNDHLVGSMSPTEQLLRRTEKRLYNIEMQYRGAAVSGTGVIAVGSVAELPSAVPPGTVAYVSNDGSTWTMTVTGAWAPGGAGVGVPRGTRPMTIQTSQSSTAGRLWLNSNTAIHVSTTDDAGNSTLPLLEKMQPGDLVTVRSVADPSLYRTWKVSSYPYPAFGVTNANIYVVQFATVGAVADTVTGWFANGTPVTWEVSVGELSQSVTHATPFCFVNAGLNFPKTATASTWGQTGFESNRSDIFRRGTGGKLTIPPGRYALSFTIEVAPNGAQVDQPAGTYLEFAVRSVATGSTPSPTAGILCSGRQRALGAFMLSGATKVSTLSVTSDIFPTVYDSNPGAGDWGIMGSGGVFIQRISD